MKSWRRLFFYIFLNILVSACTTLTVLVIWDQFYGPLPRNLLPEALGRKSGTPTAPATTPLPAALTPQVAPTESFIAYQVQSGDTFESIAAQHNMSVEELLAVNGFTKSQVLGIGDVLRIPTNPQGSVVIDSVIGAGDLASERVLLKHVGEGELSMAGWRIEDGNGNVFIFTQFMLFKGGAANIFTKKGVNTAIDLYWGLGQAIWKSGETVTLRDAQGTVRSTYKVP